MSNVLLVGGGIGQVFLARRIKARGDRLTVMAYHFLSEIEQLADQVVHQDLFDLEGSLKAAKLVCPDSVVSDQHDLYVPTVAYIAEHLGLKGNAFQQVELYCDKNRFRDFCDRNDVPGPWHCAVKDELMPEGLVFPLIIKPSDSQSSQGVSRIDRPEQYSSLVSKALSYSRNGTAILETFFPGKELVSEGVIFQGVYHNLVLGDRRYFPFEDVFIPSRTVFPSTVGEDVKKRIIRYESILAEAADISFAIVHTEWLWNPETEELCCVESALRGGGVFISSHLVPACTGIDLTDLLLDFSLGKMPPIESVLSKRQTRASAYVCFCLPEGVLESVEGVDALLHTEGVISACLDGLTPGYRSLPMEHKGQRLGPILLEADNRSALEDLISRIPGILSARVRTPSGTLEGIIW